MEEKDKFAVAARLIVVGSSRLFLLANLFWTYSDQPILVPTNLFREFEFTCTRILVFCSSAGLFFFLNSFVTLYMLLATGSQN